MPIPPSPFTSIPPGVGSSVAPPMMGNPAMGGPTGAGGPPGSPVPMPPGAGNMPDAEGQDIFQQVAKLLTGPEGPKWTMLLAGWGMGNAIDATKRFRSKPHRSNEEMQGQGYPVGTPGQTGMPNPQQMMAGLKPPTV
jgi:hypothetical protein